jgi:hypothetical protein
MSTTSALLALISLSLLPACGAPTERDDARGDDRRATDLAVRARPDAGGSRTDPEAGLRPDAGPDAGGPAGHKGIWAWSATLRGHEPAFLAWVKQHAYTDLFVLVKGISGTIKYDVLDTLLALRAAAPAGAPRIWAWVVGMSDTGPVGAAAGYLVGHLVSPDNAGYRAHLATTVRRAIDPSRGQVQRVPDGVMLDDSFQWPSQSYGGTTAHRVQSLMAVVDAIRAEIDAAQKTAGRSILLGFAPHPETSVYSGGSSILSYSAYAYGQDFGELARRCDWLVPETYRYDFYGQTSAWIGKVVQAIEKEITLECPARSAMVKVYPAIVLYTSDTAPSAASAAELDGDRSAALAAAGGYSVFRYASKSVNPGTKADGHDWPTAAQSQVLDR